MSLRPILPVIMSGGSGTRLWPLSTDDRPKQFHALSGERPMIIETALRFRGAAAGERLLDPIVIGAERHLDLTDALFRDAGLPQPVQILEPVARNTAATAALAAHAALALHPGALALLVPADHVVSRPDAFISAVLGASSVAGTRIVTFGITPTGPETGFGYIERGAPLADGVFEIASFREKPDAGTAAAYLRRGGFDWNAGVFLFDPHVLLGEFARLAPEIGAGALRALERASREPSAILLDPEAFAAVPARPVDIAIMEKTTLSAVAPCDIGWADLGSWSELWRLSDKDARGNAIAGPVRSVDIDSCLVRAEGVQVSICGVSGLIVVATEGRVLILPRERAQDVKSLIPD
jgi:mannose-1-phosphate guanylyltransferase/mannose-6-phosphate isomerase